MKNKKIHSGLILSIIFGLFISGNAFATPANPAFVDDSFYSCMIYSYNRRTGSSVSDSTNLTDAQLAAIDVFTCTDGGEPYVSDVKNITGINKLTGVRDIYIIGNQITSIDLTQVPSATWAFLGENKLTNIKVSSALTMLDAPHNKLSSIDLSNAGNLNEIDLKDNPLASIDLSNQPNLGTLELTDTNIKKLDVTHNPKIVVLKVNPNTIITADIDVEEGDVYTINIGRIASNNDPYAMSSSDPGFILRSLISNTDYYTYDPATDIITITNPDAVHGYIEVAGYRLAVPIGSEADEEADDEDIVVPDTSSSDVLAPDTGANQMSNLGTVTLITNISLIVASLIIIASSFLKRHFTSGVTFKKH